MLDQLLPIPSMYGIFTYIYHTNQPNVGKYTMHGWYGLGESSDMETSEFSCRWICNLESEHLEMTSKAGQKRLVFF